MMRGRDAVGGDIAGFPEALSLSLFVAVTNPLTRYLFLLCREKNKNKKQFRQKKA